jgi:hypothetical protein
MVKQAASFFLSFREFLLMIYQSQLVVMQRQKIVQIPPLGFAGGPGKSASVICWLHPGASS